MTRLHRTGFYLCSAGVITAFAGFWIAGTVEAIEFSSSYFWTFTVLPLALIAVVTGLSWKWPVIGACAGLVCPFTLFFTLELDTVYRYLYTAVTVLYFAGGVLLLVDNLKKPLRGKKA